MSLTELDSAAPHETASSGSPNGESATQAGDASDAGRNLSASTHTGRKPKRWDQYLLFNVAIPILLLLVGFVVIQVMGKAGAKPVPVPEATAAAALQSLPSVRVERIQSLKETGKQLELVIDGTVVPYREARVSSEVAGQVIYKSDDCEAGSIVSEGDVLMRIDPTDYELEVQRLSRQRDQEYRALGEVDQEMANTRRSIQVAEQDVDLQEQEVERQKRLKQFTSQTELDRARGALLQARQQLISLENQLELLKTRRSRLEASEQLAATQLRVAELNLRRCEIAAPISGVIVSEEADLNTFVSRGTPLVIIEDTSRVEVAASMRVDQLQWVLDQDRAVSSNGYDLPDTPAKIEYAIAGRPNSVRRWSGTLVSYDGIGIDPNTRTVPVRVIVEDPSHYQDSKGNEQHSDRTSALVRGMFVRVRLQLSPTSELVVVPARALRPGNRVWTFVPDESVLDQRLVELQAKREAALETSPSDADQPEPGESDSSASSDAPPLDPSRWRSGLVRRTESVYPIESLRLASDEVSTEEVSAAVQVAGRDWVCEAGETDLTSGSLVVTSPLNSIPPSGLPARIEIQP
ncbi:HlyD family efflux transporter periplasmic adaptor subunit [Roseiconus nitratireducens]|uniref:HlyD family efflux transporter periplasmic adaptor subunit n=1 Tax=Roseiconus nitratireducens TaxID=2605748 RepID=A0A5M6CZJ1_9BACT|nr:HlyD family efflux transporter periplasmic adaptor subunit [Roseiconus nitratireducens]KAA5540668.1 HlyD family efflux transporter periplasmic adaptor subunit [Roseiconus nitratireducens]